MTCMLLCYDELSGDFVHRDHKEEHNDFLCLFSYSGNRQKSSCTPM